MSANQTGNRLKITSFGESHGIALGVVIDGLPAGLEFKPEVLDDFLMRRRPGQSEIVTSRNEKDNPQILSGIFEGKTIGSPVAVVIFNEDANSKEYEKIKNNPRIGHADDMWLGKFGAHDHRGGGRTSGRETLARVVAGAFAKMLVQQIHSSVKVLSFTQKISEFGVSDQSRDKFVSSKSPEEELAKYSSRCPDTEADSKIINLLKQAKQDGKSYGGVAEVLIKNCPNFLGQPVFHKFKADLASAVMSVGATLGVEFGIGFSAASAEGSEYHASSVQNHYGGIRGGITTGEDISLKVVFKPTSSVMDVAKKGRHDPCIVPRAVCVLEAMTYLVLADHLMWRATDRMEFLDV